MSDGRSWTMAQICKAWKVAWKKSARAPHDPAWHEIEAELAALPEPSDAKDGFDEAAADFDCGDNSCRYAKDKGGMRTNGGCRCADLYPRKVEFFLRTKVHRTEAERDNWRDEYMHVREFATHYEAERDALKAEVATAKAQMTKMREAMSGYPEMVDKLLVERDALKAEVEERRMASPTMNAMHMLHTENAKLREALIYAGEVIHILRCYSETYHNADCVKVSDALKAEGEGEE